MSIEAVSWALTAPVESPTLRMVLVGLANHADREGRDAFPSARVLAEYACVTERTVQRTLRTLADLGLIVDGDPTLRDSLIARGDRRPNVYDLTLARGDTHDTPPVDNQQPRGDTVSPREPERGDIQTERGDTHVADGVTPMSPEPSLNRPTEPSKNKSAAPARGQRLPDGWRPDREPELVNAIGGQPAARREYDKFVDYWRATPGAKGRKVDWQATWRNWLRRTAEDDLPDRPGPARPSGDVESPDDAKRRFAELTGLEVAS